MNKKLDEFLKKNDLYDRVEKCEPIHRYENYENKGLCGHKFTRDDGDAFIFNFDSIYSKGTDEYNERYADGYAQQFITYYKKNKQI